LARRRAFADIDLATLTAAQGFRILGRRRRRPVGLFGLRRPATSTGDGLRRPDRRRSISLDAAGHAKTSGGADSYLIFGKASVFADVDLATLTAAPGLPHLRR